MRRMEHVLSARIPAAAASALADTRSNRYRLAAWLFGCCALVFAIIVIGGVTRLTRSGLSITEWQPIVGTLPPLDAAQWEEAFAKYRATPEYRLVNHGMDLDGFKRIFWWEYFHRLLGRLIGVAFLLPLVWLAVKRRIPRRFGWPLAGIFVLGALQGAMGWYMVQSGLVDDPRVSQFRLTAHLGLALAIFAAMFWAGLSIGIGRDAREATDRGLRRFAHAVAALVFVMALTGGFVAGIRAGFAYNTFPLMNGALVPPEILALEPWWRNFFWNMATVQFVHRALAWLLMLVVPMLAWRLVRTPGVSPRARIGGYGLLAALAIQVTLGIATLLAVVPLHLAAAHQAGAVLLFAAALNVSHALRRPASR